MAIAYLIITDYSKTAKRDGKQAIHIHFPESLSKMGWNIRLKSGKYPSGLRGIKADMALIWGALILYVRIAAQQQS